MKVKELLEMVDEAIMKVNLKIVESTARIFESPYTSWEFNRRSVDLEEELERLKKLKAFLEKRDPEENAEALFRDREFEELLKYLKYMRTLDRYEP
ncbi:hypothetical protein [Palaeococcus ferrophilus]|uniref:hypothetical protein n=1 Tax=Palaeococcus ferrophilus TaxID=83868 RepID=UPI00064F3A4E|nr:hypothetical protein [Palaeococcus ferrophilus]